MKIEDQDSWTILCELQRELKKEFLLVEKEQQEKIKLKREIEESIRSHHSLTIEIHDPKAELLKDEGFGNCYNFIKDVIIGISSQVELGRQVAFLAQEHSQLIHLVVHTFYENVETNDPFLKDVIRLMHRLLAELFLPDTPANHRLRIVQAWKYYMEKVDHEHYFEQLSHSTLRQLLKEEKKVNRNSAHSERDIDDEQEGYEYSWEVKNKDQLVQEFIENVEKEAGLAPPSIKIPLKAAYNAANTDEEARTGHIWQLLSSFYLKPFKAASAHPAIPTHLRERILNFIDDLISRCKFFSELSHENIGENKAKGSPHYSIIERICHNILEVNEARYQQRFVEAKEVASNSIQIKIIGGCLNLEQLQELLVLLNSHKEAFGRISERIVHRTQRIFEMSPNLEILRRERAAQLYVSLADLHYEESISSDYYKSYSNTYRTETLKQILKQVLVQLEGLGDYRTSQRCGFAQIFNSFVQRSTESRRGNPLSAQLEMKVKYLIYLLGAGLKDETQTMRSMMQELRERNSINVKLFQDTKFSLLKVYCNLRNLKLQLRGRQEGERRNRAKLQLLDRLEHFRLDFCLTSRASRNKTHGEQTIDQYRYRLASADDILLAPIDSCIHKDNPFTASHCHATSVSKFLRIFTTLPEVRYFIGNPSFLTAEQHSYTYCSENKIKVAFTQFWRELAERLKLTEEERTMLEGILYRKLAELLLGRAESPYLFPKDRQLLEQIQSRSTARDRDDESPRKRNESPKKNSQNTSTRKRRGSASIDDLPFKLHEVPPKHEAQDSIQLEQLVEIGARHITSMSAASSPLEKVRKLKELLETYRMVHDKADPKFNDTIEQLLVSSVVAARLPNLVSTLSFLEIFLPEDKLISSEGMVLKQMERAVVKVLEGAHRGRGERTRMLDC